MYPYVKEKTRQEVLNFVREERKKAMQTGDVAKFVDLNKIEAVIKTGGGILKQENPYNNFAQACLLKAAEEKKSLTLGEIQERMRECAAQWKALPEKEKKRFSSGRLEVVNLP
jgi:hypothetical protein